jgi:hypothetical protein
MVMDRIIDGIVYLTEQHHLEFLAEIQELNRKYPVHDRSDYRLEKYQDAFYRNHHRNRKLADAMGAAMAAINEYKKMRSILAEIELSKKIKEKNGKYDKDNDCFSGSTEEHRGST